LTTPPCSKEVTWLVMNHAVQMSAEQIEAFTEIMSGTNRPLQPLAGRVLELDGTP
jgi:carbonic anhydrase